MTARGIRFPILAAGLVAVLGSPMLSAPRATADDAALRRGLVLVEVSPVVLDPLRPWVKEAGAKFTITGLVVDRKRILTTAGDVRNAGLLEVRKFSSYNKAAARLTRLDLETNLAILTVDDAGFFADLRPLSWGSEPLPSERLVATRIDELFRVHRERAGIRGADAVSDYGLTHLPTVQLSVTTSFRAGGVLVRASELAGFIGYGEAENRAEALPGPVVRAFLDQEGPNAGFPAAGFGLSALVDPVLREYYGLQGEGGALVSRVLPGAAAFGVLRPEDVVLSVGGVLLDSRGFYEDERWGRQTGLLLFARRPDGTLRRTGGNLELAIVRGKKRATVSLPLRPYTGGAERIPWLEQGPPAYLMEAGFVFLELSAPLMRRRFGDSWRTGAGEVSYLFGTRRFRDRPGRDRLLVLSEVLPDAANRGYESLSFVLVESVDGKVPAALSELHALLNDRARAGAKQVEVRLAGGIPVFVPLENRAAVRGRVLQRYGLPRASSFPADR